LEKSDFLAQSIRLVLKEVVLTSGMNLGAKAPTTNLGAKAPTTNLGAKAPTTNLGAKAPTTNLGKRLLQT
jgi:hypothetical protein